MVGDSSPVVDNIVTISPQALADSAGVSVDVYSLACMSASEKGNGTAEEKQALCNTAVNKAAELGESVTTLLTASSNPAVNGFYSSQAHGTHKWASTIERPRQIDIDAATKAMNGEDLTYGGTDFFDPRDQRLLHASNPTEYTQSDTDYIAARNAEGLFWIGAVDGIDATRLMIFSHNASADIESETAIASSDGGGCAPLALFIGGCFLARLVLG